MQKRVIGFFLVILMMLSFPVYAVGSSTGAADSVRQRAEDAIDSVDPAEVASSAREAVRKANIARKKAIREQFSDKNCEDVDTRRERIKCRLVEGYDYRAPSDNTPEACRLEGEKSEKCVSLYSTIRQCYSLDGAEKDRCFKKGIGLTRSKLADVDPSERPEKARNYVVALLYDLQEKVEYKVEEGDVDPEDGARVVDQIVEIKQDILNGESRENVRAKIRELRTMWQEIMSDVEESGDE